MKKVKRIVLFFVVLASFIALSSCSMRNSSLIGRWTGYKTTTYGTRSEVTLEFRDSAIYEDNVNLMPLDLVPWTFSGDRISYLAALVVPVTVFDRVVLYGDSLTMYGITGERYELNRAW